MISLGWVTHQWGKLTFFGGESMTFGAIFHPRILYNLLWCQGKHSQKLWNGMSGNCPKLPLYALLLMTYLTWRGRCTFLRCTGLTAYLWLRIEFILWSFVFLEKLKVQPWRRCYTMPKVSRVHISLLIVIVFVVFIVVVFVDLVVVVVVVVIVVAGVFTVITIVVVVFVVFIFVVRVWDLKEVWRCDSRCHLVPLPIVGCTVYQLRQLYHRFPVLRWNNTTGMCLDLNNNLSIISERTACLKLWNYIAPLRWQFSCQNINNKSPCEKILKRLICNQNWLEKNSVHQGKHLNGFSFPPPKLHLHSFDNKVIKQPSMWVSVSLIESSCDTRLVRVAFICIDPGKT